MTNATYSDLEWAIPKPYSATDYSIGRTRDGEWTVYETNYRDDWNEATPFATFQEALNYLNQMINRY